MRSFLSRLRHALMTLPDAKGWVSCALVSGTSLLLIGGIAFSDGLIHWQPQLQDWPLRLVKVMIVPAFGEELIFRGFLVPARVEGRRPILWIAMAVLAFIGWHVVEALTFLPGAHLFLKPAFLVCTGILGLACALMRYHTGSIWPGVILHGLLVASWQVLFAGPDVTQLMRP